MTYIHIHAPRFSIKAAVTQVCPDCKKWTRMLSFFTDWYGWDATCIKCGREWSSGEWMPLPFERGARQKNIELAKQKFREPAKQQGEVNA